MGFFQILHQWVYEQLTNWKKKTRGELLSTTEPVACSWGCSFSGKALNSPAQGGVSERLQKCTWAPWDSQDSLHTSNQWAWHKPSERYPERSGPLFHLSRFQCPLYLVINCSGCCRFSSLVEQGPVPHCLHLHPKITQTFCFLVQLKESENSQNRQTEQTQIEQTDRTETHFHLHHTL